MKKIELRHIIREEAKKLMKEFETSMKVPKVKAYVDIKQYYNSHMKKPNLNLTGGWVLNVDGKELFLNGKLIDLLRKYSDAKNIVVMP